jgi:hypothetical protein
LKNIIGSLLTAIKTAPAAPDAPDSGRFVDEVGNVGPRQAEGELFPAQAETVDPFARYGAEIGRVGVGLLAAHEVCRRVRQLPVKLAEIRKDEALDLARPLRPMQPVNRSLMGSKNLGGLGSRRAMASSTKRVWKEVMKAISTVRPGESLISAISMP